MKFVKDEDDKRKDYLFQDDAKTKSGALIIIIVLVILVAAVIASGIHFKWF
ncbi:hypothetical protein DFQ11_102642 [Winogradskyella epiphytica]|uniref:Uncharacterized protein n=1 Tax=Winogradskyella epiphytica TaxID=262005 RepID=A0A2V4WYG4_9FLAO|nr:hypothetical protein [Winogradskyella epiphytica]PYE82062.1 hypothetical protein DFQ11_102642 [Winogradskyella epiphytica]GGW60745.1 hypothetical protein GCM10008085_10320 [Winogradskyella epiphytica]